MTISKTWLPLLVVIAVGPAPVPAIAAASVPSMAAHHRDTECTETGSSVDLNLGVLRASVVSVVDSEVSVTQQPKGAQKPTVKPTTAKPAPVVPAPATPAPPGYVIGPEDVLQVLYWREKDLSAEVTVRPDGMISLPLLNDVSVNGLTPDELRDKVTEGARRFVEDPSVTIVVKAINSRKVFITGEVAKPGPYPLTAPTTVLQLIATAGGLSEFAKKGDITIMRVENGKPVSYPFNYKDVTKRKNLKQNIVLKPGDTVIVP